MRQVLAAVGWVLVSLAPVAWAEPPRPIDRSAPEFPGWAIGSGVGTEVELRALVGRDGKVRRVQVVPYDVRFDLLTREMRASFDSAAVRAVRRWSFVPAKRGGKAVSAWLTLRVPFHDPSDSGVAAEQDSSWAPAAPGNDVEATQSLEPIEREAPEWPAAVPYVCRGFIVVEASVDRDGRVRATQVSERALQSPGALMTAAVESAALRAARRWRYRAEDVEGESGLVVVPIVFPIPTPRGDGRVIVGCVRDSVGRGECKPQVEIWGPQGTAVARTDDTGWFVLAAPSGGRALRAVSFCRASGFRLARPWARRGDEVTLPLGPNQCPSDPR